MYEGPARRLPWELRDPLILHQTTEDDGAIVPSSFVWPEDSDERVPVLFMLSLNEYNTLASAIDVGSDIAYGVDGLRVIWLWLRNMRTEMNLCAAIASAIMTCGDVQDALAAWFLDALANDIDFQYAFAAWFYSSDIAYEALSEVIPQVGLAPQTNNNNIIAQGDCSEGVLYAQAVNIVDTLHGMSTTFLNAVGSGVDPLSWAQAVLTLIPFAGGVFQSAFILGLGTSLATQIYPVYAGNWGALNKPLLYCDLWCEISRECSISLNGIIDFYAERAGFDFNLNSFEGFVAAADTLRSGAVSGDNLVYAMHLLMLTAMRMNLNIVGMDFGQYALGIVNAGNTPDNGYLDCDVCPPTGEWRIYSEYMPGEPLGVITVQTANTLEVEAEQGSDSVYRVAIYNDVHCVELTALDLDGSTGDHGCDGWVGGPPFVGPPNWQDRIYLYSASPFTLWIEW